MNKKTLVAFLLVVGVGLLFSGCCQIKGFLTPSPAGPCEPRTGCFGKDDCKPEPCVDREGCFGTEIKCPPPPPPPPKPKKDRN